MTHHILIVDDDEEILELFKLILEDEGYRVDTAVCDKEAIEKATANEYYLALLDFDLPDIKRTEIASTLYERKRIQNLVFATGYSHIIDFIDPKNEESRKALLKPVYVEDFVDSVRDALEPADMLGTPELVIY